MKKGEFVPLGHVADFINGYAFKPEHWNGRGKRIVRIQNLTDPTKPFNLTDHNVPTKYIVRQNDVLVSWSATLGVFRWPYPEDGLLNQHIFKIVPDTNIVYLGYLAYAIEDAIASMLRFTHGSTMRHINRGEFLSTHIYLPPLPEQRRIAAILDAADALRAKRRAALVKLDALGRAAFLEMFGDPVRNTRGWKRKALGNIGKIVTGNTPSRARPEYYGDFIEWIKSDNINTPDAYLTQADERLSELGAKVGRLAPADSILVTCIAGSPDSIGNVAIANRTVAFNQQINALIPYASHTTQFLYMHFLIGKKLVQRASTNSMKGMVNKSAFSSIEFIDPPLALQRAFSDYALKMQEMLDSQYSQASQLENLFRSLQQRAFRGELFPLDNEYDW